MGRVLLQIYTQNTCVFSPFLRSHLPSNFFFISIHNFYTFFTQGKIYFRLRENKYGDLNRNKSSLPLLHKTP